MNSSSSGSTARRSPTRAHVAQHLQLRAISLVDRAGPHRARLELSGRAAAVVGRAARGGAGRRRISRSCSGATRVLPATSITYWSRTSSLGCSRITSMAASRPGLDPRPSRGRQRRARHTPTSRCAAGAQLLCSAVPTSRQPRDEPWRCLSLPWRLSAPSGADEYVMEVAGRSASCPSSCGRSSAGPPRAGADDRRGRARSLDRCARGPARSTSATGPSPQVLRHVVHGWEKVEPWVRYEELFTSDLHAATLFHPDGAPDRAGAPSTRPIRASPISSAAWPQRRRRPNPSMPSCGSSRSVRAERGDELAERQIVTAAEPAICIEREQWLTHGRIDRLRDPTPR